MAQQYKDYNTLILTIYCFVDNFIKGLVDNVKYALTKPDQNTPPQKTHNLTLAELVTLAMFRFFIGFRNWKDYYDFINNCYAEDFPNMPSYGNFINAINKLVWFALMLSSWFMNFFKQHTKTHEVKFADSTKLEVCKIKREFSHKVCKGLANKAKSSMGWFYGFKLHIVCNDLMQIIGMRITTGTIDDRDGLEMIWNDIFGIIVADAGYLGKNRQEKASSLGKTLFAAVRANMKKLMTKLQHEMFKMRLKVEVVFSVLKLRMGLENSLPRSPLGHFAHYIWCVTTYQLKKFFQFISNKPLSA